MTKPLKSEDVVSFLEETRGLERRFLDEVLDSKKRAWRVATVAGAIALTGMIAVASLAPLKEPPEMYVVRVDKATGSVEHVSRLNVHDQDYGERTAKFWLNMYVNSCESYNWWTIQDQHDMCALLSSTEVQRQYGKKFEGPNDLTVRLGRHTNIDVDVHSITLGANQTASIRFSTVERDVASLRPSTPKNLIATVAYQYVNVPVSEDVWRVNPLGFQVIHYSVDADLSR